MTATTTNVASGFRARAEAIFERLGRAMDSYFEAQSRTELVNKLMAKSDEELAAMGLTRDRIVAYVFRDRMYI